MHEATDTTNENAFIEYQWVYCPECDEEYQFPADNDTCVICGEALTPID